MSTDRFFQQRFNQYRNMWIFVFYDLPTETKKERHIASRFRKELTQDGFTMFQFSIYQRFCLSREKAEVHLKRAKNYIPEKGKVSIMQITDKQYGQMEIFYGNSLQKVESKQLQLELF